jgi:hypothetical protein
MWSNRAAGRAVTVKHSVPFGTCFPHQPADAVRRLVFIILLALGFCFAGSLIVRADTNALSLDLPDLPLWDHSFNLRLGAGYKDNLLLNRDATESSYLLSTTVEALVLRLPVDGRQFTFFLTAEDIRYPEGDEVTKEQLVLARAQGKLELNDSWQAGLALDYLYQDQVFDVSATETNTQPLPLVGHQISLRPSLRRQLPRHHWIEGEILAQRQWFDAPVDDYWESGPKLALGRDYGHRSTVSFSYLFGWRRHDTRAPLALDGTAIPGAELEFRRHDLELSSRHNWDSRRRWRTVTRLNYQLNADNGSGYFDYRLYKFSQQLRYVTPTWEIRGQVRISHYDFLKQSASASDPASREKTLGAANLHAERKLTERFRLFADYEYERSFSNRNLDEYRVHKVLAGVDCEF